MEMPANNQPGLRKAAGVGRMIRHHLKIDMTPMVDLGFLLISFFVITTELTKPAGMDIAMPKDGPEMPLGGSNALTVLLDKDNTIYYYEGSWDDAVLNGQVKASSYAGKNSIRDVIIQKQTALDANKKLKEGRDGLMLLVKPGSKASYKNMVDILDEATICMVKKYAVVKIGEAELDWLQQHAK